MSDLQGLSSSQDSPNSALGVEGVDIGAMHSSLEQMNSSSQSLSLLHPSASSSEPLHAASESTHKKEAMDNARLIVGFVELFEAA